MVDNIVKQTQEADTEKYFDDPIYSKFREEVLEKMSTYPEWADKIQTRREDILNPIFKEEGNLQLKLFHDLINLNITFEQFDELDRSGSIKCKIKYIPRSRKETRVPSSAIIRKYSYVMAIRYAKTDILEESGSLTLNLHVSLPKNEALHATREEMLHLETIVNYLIEDCKNFDVALPFGANEYEKYLPQIKQRFEVILEFFMQMEHLEHVERFVTLTLARAAVELGYDDLFEIPDDIDNEKNYLLKGLNGTVLNQRFIDPISCTSDPWLETNIKLIQDIFEFQKIHDDVITRVIALRYGVGLIPLDSNGGISYDNSDIIDLALLFINVNSVDELIARAKLYLKAVYENPENSHIMEQLKQVENGMSEAARDAVKSIKYENMPKSFTEMITRLGNMKLFGFNTSPYEDQPVKFTFSDLESLIGVLIDNQSSG